jgi:hypothetical protein
VSLRHRHEYAVVLPRGLPDGFEIPAKEFPTNSGGCAPLPAQIHQIRAGVVVKRRKDAGSSRTPLRPACRTRTIWQYWHVPALSGPLPPSPASPGSGCPQLHLPATTGQRRRSLTSTRNTAPHGAIRSRPRPRAPPRCSHLRPRRLHPAAHGPLDALHRAAGRDLVAEAMAVQHLRNRRQRHTRVKPTPDQHLDPRQRPGLVRPAVRHRPPGQLPPQHHEQSLAELRPGHRALRRQSTLSTLLPGPPPPLHRPHAHT